MNTIQPSRNTQQAPPTDSPQAFDLPNAGNFEHELFVAQSDTEWFTKSDTQSEKERIQKEQSERKRLDEQYADVIAADSTKVMRFTDDLQEESFQKQTLSKQEAFDGAVQKKLAGPKAHLATPAVQGEETTEDIKMRFAEVLSKSSEENAQKKPVDLKTLGVKPENTQSNSAKLSGLSQMAEMLQKSGLPNGAQNAVNAQNLQLDRPTVRSLSEGQLSDMGQKNQSANGQSTKLTAKTSLSKGQATNTSGSSLTGELNKTDLNSQAKSLESQNNRPVNIEEVVGKVKLMLSTNKNEMVMRLAPEHLGKLEIRLKKEGDKLIGRFKVQSTEAKRALETQFSQLQQGLEEQGIKVEEFSILVDDQSSAESTFTFNEGRNQQQNSDESRLGNTIQTDRNEAAAAATSSATTGADSGVSLYI